MASDPSRQTTPCVPADPTRPGWHWLRHEINGTLIVKNWLPGTWEPAEGYWGTSPMGPSGTSADQMAKWGWQWAAEAVPPKECSNV